MIIGHNDPGLQYRIMAKNNGILVNFIDEQGEGFTGRIGKMSVCGVIIVPNNSGYSLISGVEGNLVITAQFNGEQSITMAWGKIGEHSNAGVEFLWGTMDSQSKKNLHNLINHFQKVTSQIAA